LSSLPFLSLVRPFSCEYFSFSNLYLNRPSESVIVPSCVHFIRIFTPGRGSPFSSLTNPVTVRNTELGKVLSNALERKIWAWLSASDRELIPEFNLLTDAVYVLGDLCMGVCPFPCVAG